MIGTSRRDDRPHLTLTLYDDMGREYVLAPMLPELSLDSASIVTLAASFEWTGGCATVVAGAVGVAKSKFHPAEYRRDIHMRATMIAPGDYFRAHLNEPIGVS